MAASSSRCAACKYLRRRCPSDCIFFPYFPSNNPYRFACIHRIYGASNVGKMLQQLPVHLRADAADSLYYEAHCRMENPAYGCTGIITLLHQEIYNAEIQLAKTQADIAFLRHSNEILGGGGGETTTQYDQQQQQLEAAPATPFIDAVFPEQNGVIEDPSSTWFY